MGSVCTVSAAGTPINWPKDSQKYDIYTNEEGMYELLFSSQQPKQKAFRRHCCNGMFPRIRKELASKMNEDHQQAIEEIQGQHQQGIEKKDTVIALMNDDLQDRDNQIQAIKYENVALQAQRNVYQAVPHARDPGKDNIIIIVRKHNICQ